MRKIMYVVVSVICMVIATNVYAISEDFKYVIGELGVPQYNVKNQEINEEIYNKYNLFVYGGPQSVASSMQRWKNLSNGKMEKNGVRGEYEVLGQDYSANIIYNYYFPLDRVTSTPVEKWTFLNISDALSSWNNAYKYYSEEQVNYMKEAYWWFQNIKGGKNDPYDQLQYNLNAIKVGLNKCRLETPATWKTKGSIFTQRRTESGGIGWANFAVEPMAANARVESYLKTEKEYTLGELDDEITVPIEYGANLKDLTEYAKAKHVKEFVSKLSVNESVVSVSSGSKITSVGNKYMLVISRNQIPQNKDYKVKIKVQSQVKTEFSADGLLQDTKEMTIVVHIKPKKINPIEKTSLKILSKKEIVSQNKKQWVVSPLAQNNESIKSNSQGITEAGRYLLLDFEILNSFSKKDITNIKIKVDNSAVQDMGTISSNTNNLLVYFKVPDNTKTTLYGWKSLREKTGNFFNVNSSEVLERKSKPHTLTFEFEAKGYTFKEELLFDTIDDYISNMNKDISQVLSVTKTGSYKVLEGAICE